MSPTARNNPLPGVRDAIALRLFNPDVVEKLTADSKRAYEIRVFTAYSEVAELVEELESMLPLFERTRTFPELTSVLKLYVISWVSLADLVAILINEAYDLGVAEQDVSFGSILRNQHISRTEIPIVVKRHGKATRYNHFVKLRNDVVHRGKLEDAELVAIRADLYMGILRRSGQLAVGDEEAKRQALNGARNETETARRVRDLIGKRQIEYRNHLACTRELLAEIDSILAARIQNQLV